MEGQNDRMIFTKELLQTVIALAQYRTARSLFAVDSDEFFDSGVDYEDIISISRDHEDALKEFTEAYTSWWKYHFEIQKAGKSGNLNPSETKELVDLIARRDSARERLLGVINPPK